VSSRNDGAPAWIAAARSALGGERPAQIHLFAPHSRLDLFLLGWVEPDPPSHAIVLWELRP
jgi:hypothetical protein